MTRPAAAVSEHPVWQEQNRGFLAAALEYLRSRLEASDGLEQAQTPIRSPWASR